jgi:hypothetical protein
MEHLAIAEEQLPEFVEGEEVQKITTALPVALPTYEMTAFVPPQQTAIASHGSTCRVMRRLHLCVAMSCAARHQRRDI